MTPLQKTDERVHLWSLRAIIGKSPVMLIAWKVVPGRWPVLRVTENLPALLGYQVKDLIGGTIVWTEITHPEDVPRLEAEVVRHLQQGTPAWTQEYRLRCRSGAYRWFRDWNHLVIDAHSGAHYIQSLMVDVTEQKAAESNLHRTNRLLCMLTQGNRVLIRDTNEKRVLTRLCRVVGENGKYPAVWLAYALRDTERSLHPIAGFGFPKNTVFCRGSLTWAGSWQGSHPGGESVRTGKPVICRNPLNDPMCQAWRTSAQKHGFGSIAGFPLPSPAGPQGTLVICASEADAFGPQEVSVLQQLAGDISFVIAMHRERSVRATLERQLLEVAEQEHHRLGHDLHDSVGQSLAAILYLVGAVQQSLGNRHPAAAADLARIATLVGETAHQIHDLSQGLYPGELRHGGIVSALKILATHTRDVFDTDCRFSAADDLLLPDADTTLQLYRIACEAVTNAAKHSRCRTISIRLVSRRGRLVLTVRDNGKGFLPATDQSGAGKGQQIMQYRAERIAAILRIVSTPGKGTTVTCSLPPVGQCPAQ